MRPHTSAHCLACAAVLLAACNQQPTVAVATASPNTSTPDPASDAELLARGEYLLRVGGCHDCHTPGYAEQQGNVDRAQWLLGSERGYRGPWGTTYASNLRLKLADMDEEEWMAYSENLRTRPIMPDFILRTMHADDRRAIYRAVSALGPAGEPAPSYLPPGQRPPPPYMELVLPESPAVAAAR